METSGCAMWHWDTLWCRMERHQDVRMHSVSVRGNVLLTKLLVAPSLRTMNIQVQFIVFWQVAVEVEWDGFWDQNMATDAVTSLQLSSAQLVQKMNTICLSAIKYIELGTFYSKCQHEAKLNDLPFLCLSLSQTVQMVRSPLSPWFCSWDHGALASRPWSTTCWVCTAPHRDSTQVRTDKIWLFVTQLITDRTEKSLKHTQAFIIIFMYQLLIISLVISGGRRFTKAKVATPQCRNNPLKIKVLTFKLYFNKTAKVLK